MKGYTHIPTAEGPETKEHGMLKNYHEKKKKKNYHEFKLSIG